MQLAFGNHVQYHEDGFWCTLCQRWFLTAEAILSHCRTTTRHEWCERCQEAFDSKQSLEVHRQLSMRHHFCQHCSDSPDFKRYAHLERHYLERHFWCVQCDRFFNSKGDLKAHNKFQHLTCNVCLRAFDKKGDFIKHERIHQPRVFECYICDRSFAQFSNLLLHLQCSPCMDGNKVEEIALGHSQNETFATCHPTDRFWCSCCGACFRSLSSLFQHAEDSPGCSYLLDESECLGNLRAYIGDML
ncbi:hypothetical protein NUU61_007157 [Penicillium alfredii]|uniref:C2H2-type domain-containing protein n=1 Tax=Penicillium alfredii TaxID=1506179 RepID=A0A9W9F2H4_9EURO|nr:uncharacterized protein NUU61_007157 [Penicillium alfredii]KAJ5092287.1 hypothetical protein NUU61_007157 [Penicillium alfredii]